MSTVCFDLLNIINFQHDKNARLLRTQSWRAQLQNARSLGGTGFGLVIERTRSKIQNID